MTNKYTLIARIFPSLIGIIPFIILFVFYVNIQSTVLKLFTGVLYTALAYFFSQFFVRLPSKRYEEWLFENGLKMPTTNLLLYSSNEYSDQFQDSIRTKIKSDFNIDLLNKEQELKDKLQARKLIRDVVKLMIGKVKQGSLVLQHNTEYGFFRNLWGASIIGFLSSCVLLYFSDTKYSIIMMILYGLYILSGHFIIKFVGGLYGKKLIEEYVS